MSCPMQAVGHAVETWSVRIMRLPNERETIVSLRNVPPCASTDNDDITDINNANEESENVRVNLNNVTNGLNVQNENI